MLTEAWVECAHLALLEAMDLDQDRKVSQKVSQLLLPVLATMGSLGTHPAGSAFQRQHPVQPKTFPALSSHPH